MSEQQENLDNLDSSTKKFSPLTPEQRAKKQERFLKALGTHGVVKVACKVAGISRQTYYDWRDHDEEFKARLPVAYEERNDTLEYAAYSQAVEGIPSYVVSQGRIVYEEIPVTNEDGTPKLDKHGDPVMKRGKPLIERKYAPAILQTLLKANMPNKYKDRSSVDLHASVSTPTDRNQMLASMNEEELDQLEALIQAAQERLQHGS